MAEKMRLCVCVYSVKRGALELLFGVCLLCLIECCKMDLLAMDIIIILMLCIFSFFFFYKIYDFIV